MGDLAHSHTADSSDAPRLSCLQDAPAHTCVLASTVQPALFSVVPGGLR
jgi:hypothetical protein